MVVPKHQCQGFVTKFIGSTYANVLVQCSIHIDIELVSMIISGLYVKNIKPAGDEVLYILCIL